MTRYLIIDAIILMTFIVLLGRFVYFEIDNFVQTGCTSWRAGYVCGAGAYLLTSIYILTSLFFILVGCWLLLNPKYKKEKERKLQEERREKYPKDIQPPMTSLEEINNELEKKLENTSPEVKDWLQKNITSPEKVILVKELDTGEKIECWLLTKKEAPYFLIYNQEKNKFGLGSQMKDKTLWYMSDYDSFYQAVSDLYSFF